MSNAALIALTSPLLMAETPQIAENPAEPPHILVESTLESGAQAGLTRSNAYGLISLQWSLAAQTVEDPAQGPPETQDPQDAADDNETSDPEGDNVIVVQGTYGPSEEDPMAEVNETSYRITQEIDDVFVEPIAYAYRDGLPGPLRDGLGNAVRNLSEPNNALNFLLQGKIGKTFETLGRLLINSTLGVGGLIDIAGKPGIGLPYRRNGWGNTLGFYGVGPGPYLFLPITGPSNARDLVGSGLDQLLLPVAVGSPFNEPEYTIPFFVVSNLDSRLRLDEEIQRIEDTVDPYIARRDTYLYRRAKTIAELRGEEPPEPPAILEEVEGTGEFADPPEATGPVTEPSSDQGTPDQTAVKAPAKPVIITRPR